MSKALTGLLEEAHELMMLLNKTIRQAEFAEADAERLAAALEGVGGIRADCNCGWWHSHDCPHWDLKACEPQQGALDVWECAEVCRAARDALRQHRERVAGG